MWSRRATASTAMLQAARDIKLEGESGRLPRRLPSRRASNKEKLEGEMRGGYCSECRQLMMDEGCRKMRIICCNGTVKEQAWLHSCHSMERRGRRNRDGTCTLKSSSWLPSQSNLSTENIQVLFIFCSCTWQEPTRVVCDGGSRGCGAPADSRDIFRLDFRLEAWERLGPVLRSSATH